MTGQRRRPANRGPGSKVGKYGTGTGICVWETTGEVKGNQQPDERVNFVQSISTTLSQAYPHKDYYSWSVLSFYTWVSFVRSNLQKSRKCVHNKIWCITKNCLTGRTKKNHGSNNVNSAVSCDLLGKIAGGWFNSINTPTEIVYNIGHYQWRIQDFPEGCQLPTGAPTWGLQNFCWKLHKNERIWSKRWACVPDNNYFAKKKWRTLVLFWDPIKWLLTAHDGLLKFTSECDTSRSLRPGSRCIHSNCLTQQCNIIALLPQARAINSTEQWFGAGLGAGQINS